MKGSKILIFIHLIFKQRKKKYPKHVWVSKTKSALKTSGVNVFQRASEFKQTAAS